MSIDDVEERVRGLAPSLGKLDAIVKFCLKGEGIISVDTTCEPVDVSRDDLSAEDDDHDFVNRSHKVNGWQA